MSAFINAVHIAAVLFYIGSLIGALSQGRYDFFLGMVCASGIFLVTNECRAYKQHTAEKRKRDDIGEYLYK